MRIPLWTIGGGFFGFLRGGGIGGDAPKMKSKNRKVGESLALLKGRVTRYVAVTLLTDISPHDEMSKTPPLRGRNNDCMSFTVNTS